MLTCTLKQPQKNKFTPGEPVEYILTVDGKVYDLSVTYYLDLADTFFKFILYDEAVNVAVEFTEHGVPLTKELFEETCYHCLQRLENYTPGIWSYRKESF